MVCLVKPSSGRWRMVWPWAAMAATDAGIGAKLAHAVGVQLGNAVGGNGFPLDFIGRGRLQGHQFGAQGGREGQAGRAQGA